MVVRRSLPRARAALAVPLVAVWAGALVQAVRQVEPPLWRPVGLAEGELVAALASWSLAALAWSWEASLPELALLLLPALALRAWLVLQPVTLSFDAVRYLWDGHLLLRGVDPYSAPPAQLAALGRRFALWPKLGFRHLITPYPPGAELLFALPAAVSLRSLVPVKALLSALDVAGLLLGLRLLRRLGRPSGRILLWAYCPLLLVEGSLSGHVDVAVLPVLSWALLAAAQGQEGAAGVALGLLAALKTYPALLGAALWRRRTALLPAAALATASLLYLPFALHANPLAGDLYYARHDQFNEGLTYYLGRFLDAQGFGHGMADGREIALGFVLALGLGVLLLPPPRDFDQTAARAVFLATAFLLLEPAVYPWYAVWFLPLLLLRPSPALLYLQAVVPFTYLTYAQLPWHFPPALRPIEFLPALALALAELAWSTRPRLISP